MEEQHVETGQQLQNPIFRDLQVKQEFDNLQEIRS